MNNASNGLISRLEMAEERISELKVMSIEISKMEKKNRLKKKKETISKWNKYKRYNIHIFGV